MENPIIIRLSNEVSKPIGKYPVWFFHEHNQLVYHYTEKGKYVNSTRTHYIKLPSDVTYKTHTIEFHTDSDGHYVKLYPIKCQITEAAFEFYPRLINDPYNPMDDDNEEYRNIWIAGAKWHKENQ